MNGSAATAAPGLNDDVTIGDSVTAVTVNYNRTGIGYNSLTVNADATLVLPYLVNRSGFTNGIINRGIIEYRAASPTNSTNLAKSATVADSFNFTNSGTLLISQGILIVSASINNSGGLISVQSGGVFDMRGASGNFGISGGTLTVSAGGAFDTQDVATPGNSDAKPITINDVAITIDSGGALLWSSRTGGTGTRNKMLSISGGSLINRGFIDLSQLGEGGANTDHLRRLSLSIGGTAHFINSGTVNISNSTPDLTPRDEYAQLTVNSSGSFANNGLITITNAATNTSLNATTPTATQYARLSVSNGANFTNSGTINISVAGAEDYAFHYATLLVSSDWTNHGVIFIDGANKSLAVASLDLNGKNYTQTGAAAELHLSDGGKVIAKNVTIDGGILSASGTGVITGNAVINNGATWEIGALGADVLNVSGDLTLSGATLSLTGSIGEGDWLIASYSGNLLGTTLNLSGLSTNFEYLLNDSVANQLYLNITAIPEPTTWALLLTGTTLLFTLRRRR